VQFKEDVFRIAPEKERLAADGVLRLFAQVKPHPPELTGVMVKLCTWILLDATTVASAALKGVPPPSILRSTLNVCPGEKVPADGLTKIDAVFPETGVGVGVAA